MSAWCKTIDRPVILDIGANNGFIATQLAQLLRKNNPRIYAFEPVPSTFAYLKSSIESLELGDLIFPVCRAVSDSKSEVKIFYNPHQSLFAQIRDDSLNPFASGCSTLAKTITIDEITDSLGFKPHLIKVDVEGFEPRVFRAAGRLLACSAPPAFCFEWNPSTLAQTNCSPSEIAQSLGKHHLYYIDDFSGQQRPFGEEVRDLISIHWVCNIFAVPNSEEATRWSRACSEAKQRIACIR